MIYDKYMGKTAISVTLDEQNLLWVKGRIVATGARSVSEFLDRLLTEARTRGKGGAARSVVGTIDIDPRDPLLHEADAVVSSLFEAALSRAAPAKKAPRAYRSIKGKKRRG